MGHGSLDDVENILKKDESKLDDRDKAFLIMNYVDGYTVGSDWARQSKDGKNEIDWRMKKI